MKFDLSGYRHIKVRPVAGEIGAEIDGVDLSRPLSDAVFAELHRGFLTHLVLQFHDQVLDADSFAAFGSRFAPLARSKYLKAVEGNPLVHRLTREADVPGSARNVGDRWHGDLSPFERPTAGFGLYCLEAPDYGGDTMFSNLYTAYEALSDGMKTLCEDLIVIHSSSGVFGTGGQGGDGAQKRMIHKGMEKGYDIAEDIFANLNREMEHPLIRIHPETGRKVLYITGEYCIRLKDMTEAESRPLLDFFNRHVTRPEFTCRFRWRKGSVLLMDNRCTQHYAVNDYEGFRRDMLRIELDGERPFGPAMPRLPDAAD